MPDLRFDLLTGAAQLHAFAPAWIALHAADPEATPFQRPEWLVPWWHQFGNDALCTVTVYRRDALRALLPFYIYTEPRTDERKLMLLGVGTTDYLDGVYAPACTPDDIIEAIEWLAGRRTWDTFSLVQIRSASPLLQAVRHMGAKTFETDGTSLLPAMRIDRLPTKIRRNAMYYRNAAQRRGALELTLAAVHDCLDRFDVLARMHTERWQGRGEAGVLADPRVLASHREALPLLARAGLLRLYTLTLAGEPIAAMYALADTAAGTNRSVYFYLPGFSLAHGDLRPGTLLMASAIEDAAAEGIATVDLLRGDEAYKQHWHPQPIATHGCSLPCSALAGQSLEPIEASA